MPSKCAHFLEITGRRTYVTSGMYLELVKSFVALLNSKKTEVSCEKEKYLAALNKLTNASNQVDAMEKTLTENQILLENMTQKAVEMAKQIEKETYEVEIASNLVKKDETVANIQAAKAQELKSECEADLAQAIPILEDAISALNTLKPTDITLVKSMKNPPDAIKLVMAAVCVMRDVKPDRIPDPATGRKTIDFWGPSKRILGDMNFLQHLKDFDKDHIRPDIMVKIRKEYLPHKDFKPHIVAKASSAAEGLCKWIIAMDMYDAVAKEVAPKKEKLEAAEKEYATTLSILNEKKDQVTKLEEKLANLNRALNEAVRTQGKLQVDVDACSNKLQRAELLISSLSEDRARWGSIVESLQKRSESLIGDILLSCGVLSYLASFTFDFRLSVITDWLRFVRGLSVPVSDEYNFSYVLGSEIKIQSWHMSGLPKDAFSTENAVIASYTKRWPLFIDPQCKANSWIKQMEGPNNCHVTKFTHGNHADVLLKCLQFGLPCLLEDVTDDLDTTIDPILFKDIFANESKFIIKYSKHSIEYNPGFRIYITTKLPNPDYPAEICNKATVIDFNVPLGGLVDQFLDILAMRERPKLKEKAARYVAVNAESVAALRLVEEDILKILSESVGDILEDEAAIKSLALAKTRSRGIADGKRAIAQEFESIEGARLEYKPVAEHAAVLYDCVSKLRCLEPVYQYSLAFFTGVYKKAIANASKSRRFAKRIVYLKRSCTHHLYENVVLSLFEKDKLTFALLLCTKISLHEKRLEEDEYRFMIGLGDEKGDGGGCGTNPASDWLRDDAWHQICSVSNLKAFANFPCSFICNLQRWREYHAHYSQLPDLPEPWDKLNEFQKLILVRIIRPDRFVYYVRKLAEDTLGVDLNALFDISYAFYESTCINPIIFIVTPGVNPVETLEAFAEAKGHRNKFRKLALGPGLVDEVGDIIEEGRKRGWWVFLQNCHLFPEWMPTLERTWEEVTPDNTDSRFRLWLETCYHERFPVGMLQNGVKTVIETPSGMKKNLIKLYRSEPVGDDGFYSGCPARDFAFARLLCGVAFFHGVVLERKRFGPAGFSVPYEFDHFDFSTSVRQLQAFVNEYRDAHAAIAYFIAGCNYGGHVEDEWDCKVILATLGDFIDENRESYVEGLKLPRQYERGVYLQHITNLPDFFPPNFFGLHDNIGIKADLRQSGFIIDSISGTEQVKIPNNCYSDELLLSLAGDLLAVVPRPFNVEEALRTHPWSHDRPMNVVLARELGLYNELIKEVRGTLSGVAKAAGGLIFLTPPLSEAADSIVKGTVPKRWRKLSYPTLKTLPKYVRDLVDRSLFFEKWLDGGCPSVFWLPGFFRAQAFFTGIKQAYSRKLSIPPDQLIFDYDLSGRGDLIEGVYYVEGLFLDGARWDADAKSLAEMLPGVFKNPMPTLQIKLVNAIDFLKKGRYECPLYSTSRRREAAPNSHHQDNYIRPLLIETKDPAAHWIKRGVAALCQPD